MPHVELPQAEFKVVMLGETFTGKTSLVLRFAEGYYRDSSRNATVGAFFITKRLSVQGMTCKVQIWDTAGQEQFKKLAPMYYKNAAAAIVCYDVTAPKSFDTLKYWIDELQQNVPAGKIVMAMCATKCDLRTEPDTSHVEALALETGALFFKTSAKNNTNVTELFSQVAERVLHFQRINSGLNIPVTLATTSVDTANGQKTNGYMNGSSNGHPVTPPHQQQQPPSQQPSTISTSPRSQQVAPAPESQLSEQEPPALQEDSDDNVVDPTDSKSVATEHERRCDTNMLMCGDILKAHEAAHEVMRGENGQGCTIL